MAVKLESKITYAKILEDIEAFKNAGKPNLTTMSIDWCDKYVAKAHPEDWGKYIKACAAMPEKERLNNTPAKDVKAIREYVIKEYFPEWTAEELKKAKERKKAEREAAKAEKEAFKNATLEEQLKARFEALCKED